MLWLHRIALWSSVASTYTYAFMCAPWISKQWARGDPANYQPEYEVLQIFMNAYLYIVQQTYASDLSGHIARFITPQWYMS